MNTYYEIKGTIRGEEEEVLFGSYEKSDCTYELDALKSEWREEGYECIRIKSRKTEEEPDTEVYGLESALLINGLKWEETERDSIYYCAEKDRYSFIVKGEIEECGSLYECFEAASNCGVKSIKLSGEMMNNYED